MGINSAMSSLTSWTQSAPPTPRRKTATSLLARLGQESQRNRILSLEKLAALPEWAVDDSRF